MEKDQEILRLITRLYVDIFEFTNEWNLPNDHYALINFIGRGMQNFENGTKPINYRQLSRKSSFSIESASKLALKIVLRGLQIGRMINRIRKEKDKFTYDWYQMAVEEDHRERERKSSNTKENTTEEGED